MARHCMEERNGMIDIKVLRDNPDAVKENIRKKFQDEKLPLVDEIVSLDAENRAAIQRGNEARKERNELSSRIGALMREGRKSEAEEIKEQVGRINQELLEIEAKEADRAERTHLFTEAASKTYGSVDFIRTILRKNRRAAQAHARAAFSAAILVDPNRCSIFYRF